MIYSSTARHMARKIKQQNIYIELLEYALSVENPLNNLKMLQHEPDCASYMVGGISLNKSIPNNRQVWKCSAKCPLNDSASAIGNVVSSDEEE